MDSKGRPNETSLAFESKLRDTFDDLAHDLVEAISMAIDRASSKYTKLTASEEFGEVLHNAG